MNSDLKLSNPAEYAAMVIIYFPRYECSKGLQQ